MAVGADSLRLPVDYIAVTETIMTGMHEQYHRPEDDANLINYAGMEQITDFVIDVITGSLLGIES